MTTSPSFARFVLAVLLTCASLWSSRELVAQSHPRPQPRGTTLPAPRDIAAHARRATVVIRALDANGQVAGQGSGFFADSVGTLVTNYHVIEGASALQVELASGDVYDNVYLMTADARRDLALLRIPVDAPPFLRLGRDEAVAVGDRVYAVGSPLGLEGTFSDGLLSARRSFEGISLLQITAPISPGSSGGPVLDAAGEVVGVATAYFATGQNLNLAVPVRYVRPLIALHEAPRRFAAGLVPPREGRSSVTNTEGSSSGRDAAAWTPVTDIVGSYVYHVKPIGADRYWGIMMMVPDVLGPDRTYRLVGWTAKYRREGFADSMLVDGPWMLDEPITVLADGRVAVNIGTTLEGGFVTPTRVQLTTTAPGYRHDPDLVTLIRYEPEGIGDVQGVYPVRGRQWFVHSSRVPLSATGNVVIVKSPPFQDEIQRVVLRLAAQNARGGSVEFAALAQVTADGTLTLDPVTMDDGGQITGTGRVVAGRLELELDDRSAKSRTLDRKLVLSGQKGWQ